MKVEAKGAEAVRVSEWRSEVARRIGFDDDDAELVGLAPWVDLRALERLVADGCPRALALRILL